MSEKQYELNIGQLSIRANIEGYCLILMLIGLTLYGIYSSHLS